jgi:alkylation response protein AidB-like acyl-CoA dehydrogenase
MDFPPTKLSADELRLREEVRAFIQTEFPPGRPLGLGMSGGHDPAFSKRLAARGWVGMYIPEEYGGRKFSAVERFVVIEELLSVGAPVTAHWIADRQTAPALLAHGSEEQRQRFLPAIAAAECYFSLGMSEPTAGSDLAGVRCRARRTAGGWLLNGMKTWTSSAHRNHYITVLCRTATSDDRHAGLSQFIVDLKAEGVRISPVPFLDGTHHFNEVSFDDVFVAEDMLLGNEGDGWRQINSELSYERSGPDRYLSTFGVLRLFLARQDDATLDPHVAEVVGRLTARFWTIRQLSLGVARAIDQGEVPAVQSALVKDIGTRFEQDVVELLWGLYDDVDPSSDDAFERLLGAAILTHPSFTIRGGTTEILRSIASRSLTKEAKA